MPTTLLHHYLLQFELVDDGLAPVESGHIKWALVIQLITLTPLLCPKAQQTKRNNYKKHISEHSHKVSAIFGIFQAIIKQPNYIEITKKLCFVLIALKNKI